jgi:hypothetical protein
MVEEEKKGRHNMAQAEIVREKVSRVGDIFWEMTFGVAQQGRATHRAIP